ncbi:VanZ family protein [Paenibacillus harenae]|uniref:VanZ family protein n=1 Tax=Paenibacillus harenae TaxID=306543 RepID=UPI002791F781|nr:VanZ family protein [Paenibacillus harenae]MDQ0059531.1 VanZ family protein [Paenibacillus harenae]
MKQTETIRRMKPRIKIYRFIPAVLWMAFIFALSSRTGEQLDTVLPLLQKLLPFMDDFNWGHFVSYFLLAMLLDYGFGRRSERVSVKLLTIVLCGAYGVTDEYHQSFVGGRMLDPLDLRNDIIGASAWVLIGLLRPISRLRRKLSHPNSQ